MKLLRAFVAHEWLTQWRASRFRLIAVAYVVIATAPVVALVLVSERDDFIVGPASFAAMLLLFQPMLTTLFAGALSVDAITREREESSFAVVSLAPMSATGYVLRRWIAIVIVATPVTLLPQLAAAAYAAYQQRSFAGLAPFAWTWLLHVAPVLLIASAILFSLGTITGRTILAILAFGAIFTIGLGNVQGVLAYAHRKLDGPWDLLAIDERAITELVWTIRGFWAFRIPSESGWPVEAAFDAKVPSLLLAGAIALGLLAIAPAFLRRTKRDVRPWRIREDHPLRTFLKTLNRIREEYTLDAGRQLADVALMVIGVVLAGGAFTTLLARESRYIDLAAQRYASERVEETSVPMLVVRNARIEGELGRELRTRATYVIENRGTRAESHLTFELHPSLQVACSVRCVRKWNRIEVTLEEPIAARAQRTLTFDISGSPDMIEFSLLGGGEFERRYEYYLHASTTSELSDLSRSRIVPAATRDRMLLAGSDFVPVFGTLLSPTQIEFDLRTDLDVAHSCGAAKRGRCSFPLASFTIAGARTRSMSIAGNATLMHLEQHTALARMHAPSLAEALTLANRAWPGVITTRDIVFERPTEQGERVFFRDEHADIRSSGALHLVPEVMFIRRQPMEPGVLAASMVASALTSRRAVASNEQIFFARFFEEAARARLVSRSRSANVGRNAPNDPLLDATPTYQSRSRLSAVFVDLEYRVGADRLAEGIHDFLSMQGEGNARQLLDAIAKRANTNLDRFYRDFFEGNAMPQLTFENVQFSRDADGWEARGTLRNEGTGEVFCPIVLRTEHGSVRRVIRIDSAQAIPFVIATPHAPRTLQLDPEQVCYRVARIGLVENVEYRGGA